MNLTFEADKTFDVPEGIYSATLDEVKEYDKDTSEGVQKYVRVLFTIDQLSTHSKIFMVGKNFPPILSKTSELGLMLKTWLGPEEFAKHQEDGGWDTNKLLGRKADVVIKHIKNRGHKKPYVHVQQILPPGKLLPIDAAAETKEAVEAAAKD